MVAKRENAPLGIDAQLPKMVEKLGQNMALTGLLQTDQGLQLVSLVKVTDEKGTAPSHGILFFTRPVDTKFIGTIKSINKTNIVLYDGKKITATDKFDAEKTAVMFRQVNGLSAPVIESAQVKASRKWSVRLTRWRRSRSLRRKANCASSPCNRWRRRFMPSLTVSRQSRSRPGFWRSKLRLNRPELEIRETGRRSRRGLHVRLLSFLLGVSKSGRMAQRGI